MKEIPPIRRRMKEFLKKTGMSEADFEKKIEMSIGWVSSIGGSIRDTTLDSIIESFPDLNISWLLTGQGDILNSDTTKVKLPEPPADTIKEVDHLKKLLVEKERAISDKDEIIQLLKEKLETKNRSDQHAHSRTTQGKLKH